MTSKTKVEQEIGISRVSRRANFLAVSGTASVDHEGKTMFPGDIAKQTENCLEIIQKALAAEGAGFDSVIRTRVYLKDISHGELVSQIHKKYFADICPASTFVEVKGFLQDDWLIEIEADCVLL